MGSAIIGSLGATQPLPVAQGGTGQDTIAEAIAALTAGAIHPENLLSNPHFEWWSSGTSVAPDGWVGATVGGGSTSREGTTVKIGTYSLNVTSIAGGGNYTLASQDVHSKYGISYWKGKTVTLGCWVYLNSGTSASIIINDGVGETSASVTSTGSWQWITVSRTISNSATKVQAKLYCGGVSGPVAYFDGAMMVEGSSAFSFVPSKVDDGVWVDYSSISTVTGWASFTTKQIYLKRIGKTCFVQYVLQGVSNATNAQFTIPWTIATPSVYSIGGAADNGGASAAAYIICSQGTSNVILYATVASPTFTASGTKTCAGSVQIEVV